MKKINYLFVLIATVFVLGMTSCDTNDVTPDPTLDGLTLSDFDGVWNTTSVNSFDASVACNEVNFGWTLLVMNVMSSSEKIIFSDECDNDSQSWDVAFDAETLVITVTGSFNQELKITDYNINTTPYTATVEVIKQGGGFTTGTVYNLQKQ